LPTDQYHEPDELSDDTRTFVCQGNENPDMQGLPDLEADARIRTADPFITSDQADVEGSLQIGFHRGSPAGLNPQ
jgi:hypothetical protein